MDTDEKIPQKPPQKPRNRGGRPKGSKNRRNLRIERMGADLANGSVREIVFATFDLLGGLARLLEWAEANPEKFYKDLFLKMGPRATPGRPMAEARRDAPTESAVEVEDFT